MICTYTYFLLTLKFSINVKPESLLNGHVVKLQYSCISRCSCGYSNDDNDSNVGNEKKKKATRINLDNNHKCKDGKIKTRFFMRYVSLECTFCKAKGPGKFRESLDCR